MYKLITAKIFSHNNCLQHVKFYAVTTTPTLLLSQNSQSIAGVAFVIDDARCVTTYHVIVTQEGGPTTSVSRSSLPVIVGDLDLCRGEINCEVH